MILDLLTTSWSTKAPVSLYIKSEDTQFLQSLLQQFNFGEVEEAAPAEESEDAEATEEVEGESKEKQQQEQQ